MTKETVIQILREVKRFKEKTGIEIVDTHVHPSDVMGVVHYSEVESKNDNIISPKDYLESGIFTP